MIGRLATFDSSRVRWPVQSRVDESGRRVDEQTEPAEPGLALEATDEIVPQHHPLERRAQHELPRMQDQRLLGIDLHELGEGLLVLFHVDDALGVAPEDPEVPVDVEIDR